MSIKYVHILFICASVLVTVYLGWWALTQYQQTSEIKFVLSCAGSFTLSLILVVYGYSFLKKIKTHNL